MNRWRVFRRALASASVLLLVVALIGVPVYVRPQIDQLRPADAIFVLGGQYLDRYPFGLALASQGLASTVVLSNPDGASNKRVYDTCIHPPPKITVMCFAPDPSTTKGEGRELRRLAAQYGWKTVIVVTFGPHLSRARYILRQCFDGDLVVVASPARLTPVAWAYQYLYQTAGYVRAVLQPGC